MAALLVFTYTIFRQVLDAQQTAAAGKTVIEHLKVNKKGQT